jgi:hypothetical protein
VFWVPVGALLMLRDRLGAGMDIGWWLLIGALAVYLHTRTLLAPFLAVHANLPATLAALEAWRLSARAFRTCLTTLLAGSLPLALPLGLLALVVFASLPQPVREALEPALPDLAYAGIQVIRPLLIPATYLLFRDLWDAELARRATDGSPPVPMLLRPMLALTRPLPNLAPRA